MAVDFSHKLVGRAVVYRGSHPDAEAEQGIVTSVNAEAGLLFVSYRGNPTSAATAVEDLKFLDGKKVTLER